MKERLLLMKHCVKVNIKVVYNLYKTKASNVLLVISKIDLPSYNMGSVLD